MIAKLKDLIITRSGEQIISFVTGTDFTDRFDELKDGEVNVEIKKYRKRRSLDANAYAWVLIDKLAARLKRTKEEIYRETIRNIGGVSETVCIQSAGIDRLREVWSAHGTGWQVEKTPSKIPGCVNATLYYGSSVYDTDQMSAMIDSLIQDCQAVGIETMTPNEIEELKSLWANAPRKENNYEKTQSK